MVVTKLVVLDRDGVINHDSDAFIKTPDDWKPIKGSLEAIARLSHDGYTVVVASNQSGVARKLFTVDTLALIHEKMYDLVEKAGGQIDSVFYCPHGPDDGCNCRKPKPGMLLEIGQRYNISLKDVWFIGDSVRDIESAISAHAVPVLVRSGKGAKAEKILKSEGKQDVPVYDDLAAAVDALLK